MSYFVFNIKDTCQPDESINEFKKKNLEMLIETILSTSGTGQKGQVQFFKIPEENKANHKFSVLRQKYLELNTVSENYANFIYSLAHQLLEAELVTDKDGTKRRNKVITSGVLIVKHQKNKLTLLKLEETRGVDMDTYEMKTTFSTDKSYFKAAIILPDKIRVIDKNKKVANYWSYGFLELEREKDDQVNTEFLVDLYKSKQLLTDAAIKTGHSDKIEETIQDLLMTRSRYSVDEWLEEINYQLEKYSVDFDEIESIFTDKALDYLDSSFELNRKYITKSFKTEIKINDGLVIHAIALKRQIKKQSLIIENGYIRIPLSKDQKHYIDELIGKS